MKKYVYFDLETKNDPSVVGWKNFKEQGISVGVIGYEIPIDDEGMAYRMPDLGEDENSNEVSHLFPNNKDLFYEVHNKPAVLFTRLKKFIDNGYEIVGFNTIHYDNNLISNVVGKINPESYLDVPVGGNKGTTLWKDVDDGYINFLITNKAGAWTVASAIKDYRESKYADSRKLNPLVYVDNMKEYLDKHSYDIMSEIIKVTGGRWSAPFNLVCHLTIGYGKSDDGSNVPEMYKNGDINRIAKYCVHDVRLSWLLHLFILKYKYVLIPLYRDMPNLTSHQTIKVPFDGSIKNISGESINILEL